MDNMANVLKVKNSEMAINRIKTKELVIMETIFENL